MLKKIMNILTKKDGIGTLWVVVMLGCLTPLFIFGFMDVPYYIRVNRRMKNTADDIAASAVTYLNEARFREGLVLLDGTKAEEYILNELKIWYSIDCSSGSNVPIVGSTSKVKLCKIMNGQKSLINNRTPYVVQVKDDSGLPESVAESSHIEYIIHEGILDNASKKYVAKNYKLSNSDDVITLTYPSVLVYIKTDVEGLMLHYPVKMMKTGYSQTGLSATSASDEDFYTENGSDITATNAIQYANAVQKGDYLIGFMKDSTNQYSVSEIISILNKYIDVSFRNTAGATVAGSTLKTGYQMIVSDKAGGQKKSYTIVVFGDLNGDGLINNSDLAMLNSYLQGTDNLTAAGKAAADVNHDGRINVDDTKTMQNHLSGSVKIQQNY